MSLYLIIYEVEMSSTFPDLIIIINRRSGREYVGPVTSSKCSLSL